MLYHTEGIVLGFIKYRETSIISKIYTREFGLKSYIVNGIRSSKKSKIAFFQPLTLLQLVVYNRPSVTLHRIAELRCAEPYISLNKDPLKVMISLFISEIIQKTIKEETANEELFSFFKETLQTLDRISGSISNFHLVFLLKYSFFLGFMPESGSQILEMCEGQALNEAELGLLNKLYKIDYLDELKMENHTRKKIMNLLLRFYAANMEGIDSIQSASILSEVLSK